MYIYTDYRIWICRHIGMLFPPSSRTRKEQGKTRNEQGMNKERQETNKEWTRKEQGMIKERTRNEQDRTRKEHAKNKTRTRQEQGMNKEWTRNELRDFRFMMISMAFLATKISAVMFRLGDRHKFLDLLYNLITNACKFTTMGTVPWSKKTSS